MKGDLNRFFEPKSVAIIGASENVSKVGGILLKKALKSGIETIPVNPSHEEIMGKKCYKSVLDYSKKIDLSIVAVPAAYVPQVLIECGKKEIRNVILISAGFSEVGNKKGVEEISKIVNRYGIRFLGANCFGVCNPSGKLDLTFSSSVPSAGKVAFISQSGALWSYVADFLKDVGFSKFVSLGNMENLEFGDFVEYFGEDKRTKSIVLYIEKLNNGKRFMEACKRAIKRGKKIYAVKAGSSVVGKEAAISHTASLASDYAVYAGALKQCGVVLCESLFDAFVLASGKKIIYDKKNLEIGKKVFILTNAGGPGVLISDYLSKKEVNVVEKPLDILGTALSADYKKYFNEIKNKDLDSLLVVLTPQSMSEINETARVVVDFKKELSGMGKSVFALFLGGDVMEEANRIFEKNGVKYSNTIEGM